MKKKKKRRRKKKSSRELSTKIFYLANGMRFFAVKHDVIKGLTILKMYSRRAESRWKLALKYWVAAKLINHCCRLPLRHYCEWLLSFSFQLTSLLTEEKLIIASLIIIPIYVAGKSMIKCSVFSLIPYSRTFWRIFWCQCGVLNLVSVKWRRSTSTPVHNFDV